MTTPRTLFVSTLVTLAACAPSAALAPIEAPLHRGDVDGALARYEELVRRRTPDRGPALARIAAVTLEQSARASERSVRDSAFVALGALGETAEPVLQRLVRAPEPVASRAIGALLRIDEDDHGARLARAVRSEFPEARSAALVWLREEEDWDQVGRMVLDVDAAVRRAALDSLYLGPVDRAGSLPAMIDVLRNDPAPAVRAAAARLVARRGPEALEALEEALADQSLPVQVAAASALARMEIAAGDPRSARRDEVVRQLASGEPTAAGIESARLLGERDEGAVAYLRRALTMGTSSLRLQAVIAASAVAPLRRDVRGLLEDPSAELRLRAAAALARNSSADRARATRTLQNLLEASPMVALQAAIVFSEFSDRRGLPVAVAQLRAPHPALRALAAYVVGERIGAVERVRSLLVDRDPTVRVAAARAILHPRIHPGP